MPRFCGVPCPASRVCSLPSLPVTCTFREEETSLLTTFCPKFVMIRWTGLAPWEFEFPFPGSLVSTFPVSWVCGVPSLPGTCAFV